MKPITRQGTSSASALLWAVFVIMIVSASIVGVTKLLDRRGEHNDDNPPIETVVRPDEQGPGGEVGAPIVGIARVFRVASPVGGTRGCQVDPGVIQ